MSYSTMLVSKIFEGFVTYLFIFVTRKWYKIFFKYSYTSGIYILIKMPINFYNVLLSFNNIHITANIVFH